MLGTAAFGLPDPKTYKFSDLLFLGYCFPQAVKLARALNLLSLVTCTGWAALASSDKRSTTDRSTPRAPFRGCWSTFSSC